MAEKRLDRIYNEKARFAFALHLQSTLDRVREGHMIVHPDLNNVRKNFKREFQVAIDLSTIIEEEEQVEIPFDEIGFISMFLSINLGESEPVKRKQSRCSHIDARQTDCFKHVGDSTRTIRNKSRESF